MPLSDAIVLDDLYPDGTQVSLRPGAVDWVTGAPAAVETLMVYAGGTTQTLFAAANTAFYNVTASGALGAAVQSGLTNARWQSINFATSSANYLIAANGVDKPRYWDGAAWVAVDGVSVPAITAVTTTTLHQPVGHNNRLWFLQVNTLIAWYLPVDAVGGAAVAFPLRSYATRGGYLITAKNWSYDTNNGPKNFLSFFTSEGECIVFEGTDPAAAATWVLVGVYYVGQLLNDRCVAKADGDVLILTRDGLYPMTAVARAEVAKKSSAWSDLIRDALSASITATGTTFGWEVRVFPDAKILLINVPVSSNMCYQYVMNLTTKRWCRVTKWVASTFAVFNGTLYGGFATKVAQVWTGVTDFGGDIVGVALPAFTALKAPAMVKQVHLARIYYKGTGRESMLLSINTDFSVVPPTDSLSSVVVSSGAIWGSAVWGSAYWPGGSTAGVATQTPNALGYQISATVQVASKDVWSWYATDVVYTKSMSVL